MCEPDDLDKQLDALWTLFDDLTDDIPDDEAVAASEELEDFDRRNRPPER